jgi:hypothetical protein
MPTFLELMPPLVRAHENTRRVIPSKGCQLAASLLTLELGRAGLPAEYVCGFYSANPEQEHWWVEVRSVLLDPTRDQFDDENPFSETYQGHYERVSCRPAAAMHDEVIGHLRLHWSFGRSTRPAIEDIVALYGLDLEAVQEPMAAFPAR